MFAQRYHVNVLLRPIVPITVLEYESDVVFEILGRTIYTKSEKDMLEM